MEIRDLPKTRNTRLRAPVEFAPSKRDLVERLVPIAAVLAAVVTLLIIWW